MFCFSRVCISPYGLEHRLTFPILPIRPKFFARLDRIRARHAAQAATVSLASSDDGRGDDPGFDDDECNRLVAHADVEMGPINIYDLYVDVCNNKAHARAYHWAATLAAKGSPLGYLLANTGRGSKVRVGGASFAPFLLNPCGSRN